MIFFSTFVKVVSVTSILLIAGGSTYYYASYSNVQEQSHNLKRHHQHLKHNTLLEKNFHTCNHGHFIQGIKLEEPVRPRDIPIEASLAHEMKLIKNHKQENWQTIKIKTDYTHFTASQALVEFIENKLMKAAIGFLKAAIKVYPTTTKNMVGQCQNFEIPRIYENSKFDLVLLVSSSHADEDWLARAGACKLDGTTFRPTAGTRKSLGKSGFWQ